MKEHKWRIELNEHQLRLIANCVEDCHRFIDGDSCPNDNQRKFMAETYHLYREIYHQITLDEAKYNDMGWNVYLDETLACSESGEQIKVERVE